MKRCRAAVIALCALAAFAAGCASSPPSRYYTLSSTTAPAAAAATAATSGLSIAVGPVRVPALVDRPEIVVSTGANEVRLEEFHRWAASLQEDLARVIAGNLIAALGTPRVSVFPQAPAADADYRVAVEVQRFESMPGNSVALEAAWSVRRSKDGREEHGRSSVSEPVQNAGFDALAAAHSRAAARLAQDVADVIRRLEKPQ
jgi:uncharacterized protein